MKELSIEEKAKRYDEAIKIAMNNPNCFVKDVIEEMFPELKESEDERIKHEIKVILANTDFSRFALDYTFVDMIAWLEKQGENHVVGNNEMVKPVDKVEPKFKKE